MNCDYIPAKLVERASIGPLAPYIKPYVSMMYQAGFVPAYVRENLTVLAAFGRRLERCGLGPSPDFSPMRPMTDLDGKFETPFDPGTTLNQAIETVDRNHQME
jgi:hypothetical protein